ncbi:MAG: biotin-dependent carboxyltransferase [Halioglobus sp.]|nr:biotin-dependent carboxyltransferase [Halioglobus sp.]
MSLTVIHPGVLSLLQDRGRRGQQHLGLTTGGPLDATAFQHCNRLLQNPPDCTVIEISVGGLQATAQVDTFICLTGAAMSLHINGEERPSWEVQALRAGDSIRIGFAHSGCRAYLGVADGFNIKPSFGSSATVVRECIGGLHGTALCAGDRLPCATVTRRRRFYLPDADRPRYHNKLTVRVIPGYQQHHFSRQEKRNFFGKPYRVSAQCDRMGYRLEGPTIRCNLSGLLSEGICFGAIQIPPDGQPIVLLNDRQTIGGYPKIGAALSLDAARLAQLTAGATVYFTPISVHTARRALQMAEHFILARPLRERQA